MYYLVASLARTLIYTIEFLLVARAILSWLPQAHGSKLQELLLLLTEPIVMPFRNLLHRFEAMRRMPIDLSVLCAFLMLELLLMLL